MLVSLFGGSRLRHLLTCPVCAAPAPRPLSVCAEPGGNTTSVCPLHFLGYHENGVVKAENGTSPRTKKLKSP